MTTEERNSCRLDPSILDGFSLASFYASRNLEYSWWAAALRNLDTLRRTQRNYRPRFLSFPENYDEIVARSSNYYQVWVKPGSWLYAVNFSSVDEGGSGPVTTFSLQIRESCSNLPLYSEPAGTEPFVYGSASLMAPLRLLPVPKPILGPGLLHIEILDTQGQTNPVEIVDTNRAQVTLFIAEPKELV
jgi:hypothetical protein